MSCDFSAWNACHHTTGLPATHLVCERPQAHINDRLRLLSARYHMRLWLVIDCTCAAVGWPCVSSHSVNHPPKRLLTIFPALGRSLSLKLAVLRENGTGVCLVVFPGEILRESESRRKNQARSEPLDFLYEKSEAPGACCPRGFCKPFGALFRRAVFWLPVCNPLHNRSHILLSQFVDS